MSAGKTELIYRNANNINQILAEFFLDSSKTKLSLGNGEQVFIALGNEQDVEAVTELIHLAFEVWKKKGLDLSPMHQTSQQTQEHLLGKGLVLKDEKNQLIGTVSFDLGHLRETLDKYMFFEGNQEPAPYRRQTKQKLEKSQFLIFKKLAVHPDKSKIGLGKAILKMAENLSRQLKLQGVILETVQEADWLYDWYSKENYKTIGLYTYPSSSVETVLMLKLFSEEAPE